MDEKKKHASPGLRQETGHSAALSSGTVTPPVSERPTLFFKLRGAL